MELFFFLILVLVAGAAYFHTKSDPNVWANTILFLSVFILAISLYTSGITIPNTGVTYTGSTATFTGTTYTMANTPIIVGAFWILFAVSITGLGITIGLLTSSRVDQDGRIR